ncbi:MAG TPA: dihydroneopterin aldolase [Chitinophagaceae bacterium]
MTGLITIELKRLRFLAYHGLYAEEKKTGNEFEINLSVSYSPSSGTITGISDTVDYSELYTLLKTEMQHPRHLLETLVMELAEVIHVTFPKIKKIEISITKLHVPIAKFTGTAGVRFERDF